jgi:hypothetical protein
MQWACHTLRTGRGCVYSYGRLQAAAPATAADAATDAATSAAHFDLGSGLPFSNAAFSPYLATIFFFVSRPVVWMTNLGTRRALRSATHLVNSAARARRFG